MTEFFSTFQDSASAGLMFSPRSNSASESYVCSLPQWAAPGAIPYGATATGSDSSPNVSVPPRRGVGVANDRFEAAVAPPASAPAATAPAPTAPAFASSSRRLSPLPSWASGVSSAMWCPSFSMSIDPPQGTALPYLH